MDKRVIGIMDSGLGGLTSLKELKKLLPNESIIYFGDTDRAPYGILTPNTVVKYAAQIASFLEQKDIKALVIACGTSSAIAKKYIERLCSVPVFGVVEPSCIEAIGTTKNKKVGIIGTSTTIRNGMFEKTIKQIDETIQTYSAACQSFVDLVERGFYSPDEWEVKTTIEKGMYEIKNTGIDTLILGCTHFPVLKEAIGNFMGRNVNLISSGAAVVHNAVEYMTRNQMLSDGHEPTEKFYTTGSRDSFSRIGGGIIGEDISEKTIAVKKEDLPRIIVKASDLLY